MNEKKDKKRLDGLKGRQEAKETDTLQSCRGGFRHCCKKKKGGTPHVRSTLQPHPALKMSFFCQKFSKVTKISRLFLSGVYSVDMFSFFPRSIQIFFLMRHGRGRTVAHPFLCQNVCVVGHSSFLWDPEHLLLQGTDCHLLVPSWLQKTTVFALL